MTTLVIQIPAYNEAATIGDVLASLPAQLDGVDRILRLVIDDGSSDDSAQVALANGADFVLRHRANRGLSTAFISGVKFGLALGADIIVNTDADGQYPGRAIPTLIAPVLAGEADLVVGDRQLQANAHFSPFKRLLESLGSWFIRQVSRTNVPDAASGFRAFSRFEALPLQVYNPYSYTLETLIQAGRTRSRIASVPIQTQATPRKSRLHKGIHHFIWKQAGAVIRSYVLYQPLRTFLSVGAVLLLAGLALLFRFLVFYLTGDGAGHMQSVSVGGTLSIIGIILIIIGFLADSLRANRQLIEETLVRQRDSQRVDPDSVITEFLGNPIFTPSRPR